MAAVPKLQLTPHDYEHAAELLQIDPAVIEAVGAVEAPNGGFLPTGEPTILFERHWFSKLTGRKYDAQYPDISNRVPGGYLGGAAEHLRLQRAVALDRQAALDSASWGKFQIMGFNHLACGVSTTQQFVNLMYTSEGAQLALFCNYLRTAGLVKALQTFDFRGFAARYNGPNYADHNYDGRMLAAYHRYDHIA